MKIALITGASSGIGLERARIAAAENYRVVISARPSERLDRAAQSLRSGGAEVEVVPADLAEAGGAAQLADAVAAMGIVPDVLINNAGFGIHGPFLETDEAAALEMVQVNIAALTRLTRRIVPAMVQRGSGQVMNIASTAAFQPGPYMAVYYASKAYVLSFSQALGYELRHSGVTVTAVCPGPTTTEFQKRAGTSDSPLFRNNTMTAEAVARQAWAATRRQADRDQRTKECPARVRHAVRSAPVRDAPGGKVESESLIATRSLTGPGQLARVVHHVRSGVLKVAPENRLDLGGKLHLGHPFAHELQPALAGARIHLEGRVPHAQARMAALLDIDRRTVEPADEKQPQPPLRRRQIAPLVHRPQDRIPRYAPIKRRDEPGKSVIANHRINIRLGEH